MLRLERIATGSLCPRRLSELSVWWERTLSAQSHFHRARSKGKQVPVCWSGGGLLSWCD